MTTTDTATWRKARRSNGGGGSCVEVKAEGTTILIRDSKYLRNPRNNPEVQPIISITVAQWCEFVEVATGRSEALSEPAITVHTDGSASLESADGIHLDYTPTEWLAFSSAVDEGEFDDLADLADKGANVGA
ncbi:DUF397 domain-containing protein [Nocardia sp. CNY236]|uniref:DUF397 domain-containing protein n=1 Tax=Nocardia sp. CNY236 TaxID=1169152 RepID=UPI00048A8ABA|nr:DUF397 domain-containing protein [Nocardia sp. CNY236]